MSEQSESPSPQPETTPLFPRGSQPPRPGGGAERRRDNLDLLKAFFLGLVATALFYQVFPLPFIDKGQILNLFNNPVSEVITGMTFWSLFLLAFRFRHYRAGHKVQQAFFDPKVLGALSPGVYAKNVDSLLAELNRVLGGLKLRHYTQAPAYLRVYRVLQYIRSIPKRESINDLLDYQAQIDLKKLEAKYTILQVFIWAIPILGFIGTVMGIGAAVGDFSLFIQTAEGGVEFSTQMRTALGGVTSGLAVAFNTTFLALVLVIPVMILTSLLQKNEEEVLLAIEEYCLEELLPNLHIAPSDQGVSENFDEHMHRIMQLSGTWLGQLEPLVQGLSQQMEAVSLQVTGIQPLIQKFTDRLQGESGAHAESEATTERKGEINPPNDKPHS